MVKIMKNREDLELVTWIFWDSKTGLEKFLFLVIYDLGNFDVLIQSGLWAIRKITFANLYKAIHNAIIFPVSSELLNMETVKEKGKITKN